MRDCALFSGSSENGAGGRIIEVQAVYDRDANRLILPGDIRFRNPKKPYFNDKL